MIKIGSLLFNFSQRFPFANTTALTTSYLISDEFDYAMGQTLSKVVPAWDTDLNLRLQQLDSVLASAAAAASASFSSKSANSTTTSEDEEVNLIPKEKAKKKKKKKPLNKHYTCPFCDAIFLSCGARNSHRKRIHERFHLCTDCDVAFSSAKKLERHLKSHSGIKEFKCQTCDKEFMIERNLVSLFIQIFSYYICSG